MNVEFDERGIATRKAENGRKIQRGYVWSREEKTIQGRSTKQRNKKKDSGQAGDHKSGNVLLLNARGIYRETKNHGAINKI